MMDHLITKKWVVPKPFQLSSSSQSAVSSKLKPFNASVESSTTTQFGRSSGLTTPNFGASSADRSSFQRNNRPTAPNFEVSSADRSSFHRNNRTLLSSSDEALMNFLCTPNTASCFVQPWSTHPTSSSKQFGKKHSTFRSSIFDLT